MTASATKIIVLLLQYHIGFSEIIPFTCVNRSGKTIRGYNTISTISCQSSETLVSCGVTGSDDIGGTFIENGICTAWNLNNDTYSLRSEARCCTFPPDVVVSISTPSSLPSLSATTTCTDSNSFLTGCHVQYASGPTNKLRGSYTNSNITAITDTWRSTNNRCNAEASEGTVTASANCLSIHNDYTLRCETTAKWTNYANFGGCNTDYTMTACNIFDPTRYPGIDKYYVDSNGFCHIQKNHAAEVYGNAICCQLWRETPTPTVQSSYSIGISIIFQFELYNVTRTIESIEGIFDDIAYGIIADYTYYDCMDSIDLITTTSLLSKNDDYKGVMNVTVFVCDENTQETLFITLSDNLKVDFIKECNDETVFRVEIDTVVIGIHISVQNESGSEFVTTDVLNDIDIDDNTNYNSKRLVMILMGCLLLTVLVFFGMCIWYTRFLGLIELVADRPRPEHSDENYIVNA